MLIARPGDAAGETLPGIIFSKFYQTTKREAKLGLSTHYLGVEARRKVKKPGMPKVNLSRINFPVTAKEIEGIVILTDEMVTDKLSNAQDEMNKCEALIKTVTEVVETHNNNLKTKEEALEKLIESIPDEPVAPFPADGMTGEVPEEDKESAEDKKKREDTMKVISTKIAEKEEAEKEIKKIKDALEEEETKLKENQDRVQALTEEAAPEMEKFGPNADHEAFKAALKEGPAPEEETAMDADGGEEEKEAEGEAPEADAGVLAPVEGSLAPVEGTEGGGEAPEAEAPKAEAAPKAPAYVQPEITEGKVRILVKLKTHLNSVYCPTPNDMITAKQLEEIKTGQFVLIESRLNASEATNLNSIAKGPWKNMIRDPLKAEFLPGPYGVMQSVEYILSLHKVDELAQHKKVTCELCECEMIQLDLERHMTKECPMRTVTCPYCEEKFLSKDLKPHQDGPLPEDAGEDQTLCPEYAIKCKNRCGTGLHLRKNMEAHLKESCPNAFVPCKYACLGCPTMVKRREIKLHQQKQAGKHIALLEYRLNNVTDVLAEQFPKLADRLLALPPKEESKKKKVKDDAPKFPVAMTS